MAMLLHVFFFFNGRVSFEARADKSQGCLNDRANGIFFKIVFEKGAKYLEFSIVQW